MERQKSCYRQLQALAKKLHLPGNVKHHVLEAMVQARSEGDENLVRKLIADHKEAKWRRRSAKFEARRAACNEVMALKSGCVEERAMYVGHDETRDVSRDEPKKESSMNTYVRSLLLLPQDKRAEVIQRSHQMALQGIYKPFPESLPNFKHQFISPCSRSFRGSVLAGSQLAASSIEPDFPRDSENECGQENDDHWADLAWNHSTFPLNPNQCSSSAELIVPFNDPSDYQTIRSEQIYEELEELHDYNSSTSEHTQWEQTPNDGTVTSQESEALIFYGNAHFQRSAQECAFGCQTHLQLLQESVGNKTRSDRSDRDAVSSARSRLKNYLDAGKPFSLRPPMNYEHEYGSIMAEHQGITYFTGNT